MPRESFDEVFRAASRWRQVAPQIRALLEPAFAGIHRRPPDLPLLMRALDDLLSYLASDAGRTDANCTVVDAFFARLERDSDWSHLPPPLRQLLSDMGGTLHDTVHAPQVASHFESTPEQLLERLRKIAAGNH